MSKCKELIESILEHVTVEYMDDMTDGKFSEAIESLEGIDQLEAELGWWRNLVHRHHKNWERSNLKEIVQSFIDKNEKLEAENKDLDTTIDDLRGDLAVAVAENDELKQWYDSLMEHCTKGYYKCVKCGGPVAEGLCCGWCKTTAPYSENPEGKE